MFGSENHIDVAEAPVPPTRPPPADSASSSTTRASGSSCFSASRPHPGVPAADHNHISLRSPPSSQGRSPPRPPPASSRGECASWTRVPPHRLAMQLSTGSPTCPWRSRATSSRAWSSRPGFERLPVRASPQGGGREGSARTSPTTRVDHVALQDAARARLTGTQLGAALLMAARRHSSRRAPSATSRAYRRWAFEWPRARPGPSPVRTRLPRPRREPRPSTSSARWPSAGRRRAFLDRACGASSPYPDPALQARPRSTTGTTS
jgi:hypothetical protein